MRVDVWADVACPFCWIGMTQLQNAAATVEFDVDIVHHAFQLDPDAPRENPPSVFASLARKFNQPEARIQTMVEDVEQRAADEGLPMQQDRAVAANTFDAHRLVKLAAEHGRQDNMLDRLYRAYFDEGRNVADHAALVDVASDAGIEVALARDVLESDRYADDVRDDLTTARQMGANGVPFFVLDETFAVSGAQGADRLRAALEHAYANQAREV